ncbi:hypothetical protein GCM10017744_001650 [Streptomyces antimycoticus]
MLPVPLAPAQELPAPVVKPPPCGHTITGWGRAWRAGAAVSGVVTFRWRQSSLVLPPGTSPGGCGEGLAGRVAFRVPGHGVEGGAVPSAGCRSGVWCGAGMFSKVR